MDRLAALGDYRRAAFWRFRGARIGSRSRVGPRCTLADPGGLVLGQRVVLEAGGAIKLVSATARARFGDHVFVGRDTIFDISHRVTIGEGTLIAPRCFITDHDHGIVAGRPIWQQECRAGEVVIGAGAWLGAHVLVLPGVTIGDGAVVAAGAVVNRDVAPMSIVAGVPARFIRDRR